jgi:hypothetical protein
MVRRTQMTAPRPRKWRGALRFGGLSLAAHALLLILLGPPEPPPVNHLEVAELELVRPRPSPRPESGASQPQAPPEQRPDPGPAPRSEPRQQPRARRHPAPPSPPALPAPRPEPRLSLQMPPRKPDLRALLPADEVPPRAPAAAPTTRRPRPLAGPEKDLALKRRLDEVLAQDRARRNVTEGRVHQVLYSIQRDAEKVFDTPWSLAQNDQRRLGTMTTSGKSLLRAMGKGYLDGVKEFMQLGAPLPGDKQPGGGALEGYARVIKRMEKDAGGMQCILCVDLGPGLTPVVRVLRSSRRRPFDRLASRALLKAARTREIPAEVGKVTACYRFVAQFFRVPPMPTILCNFEENDLTFECYYPGKKIIRMKVKLQTVREQQG